MAIRNSRGMATQGFTFPKNFTYGKIRELNKIERNNHVKTFVGVEAVS